MKHLSSISVRTLVGLLLLIVVAMPLWVSSQGPEEEAVGSAEEAVGSAEEEAVGSAEEESAAALVAPSATIFSYQGQLLDPSGNPITANVPMSFKLYDAATSGTTCWQEEHSGDNTVNIQNGLFHVLLGQITAIDAACVTGDAYLELVVNGETLTPREMLTSVATAVTAHTLPDGIVTTTKIAAGAVGSSAVANNSLTASDLAPNSVGNSEIATDAVGEHEIANHVISSDKLALNHGKACLTSNTTIQVPGGWGNHGYLNDLNLSINLGSESSVMVWMDGLANFHDVPCGTESAVFLWVGDMQSNPNPRISEISLCPGSFNINGLRIIDLPAGDHPFKVGAWSGVSTDLEFHGSYGYETCINYLVLGKK